MFCRYSIAIRFSDPECIWYADITGHFVSVQNTAFSELWPDFRRFVSSWHGAPPDHCSRYNPPFYNSSRIWESFSIWKSYIFCNSHRTGRIKSGHMKNATFQTWRFSFGYSVLFSSGMYSIKSPGWQPRKAHSAPIVAVVTVSSFCKFVQAAWPISLFLRKV